MPTEKLRLMRREEVAERTTAFHLTKPEGFRFKAGQFLRYTLIDPPETDAEGSTRSFSIASAPHEDYLMLATRMRDTAFKRVLSALPIGSEIEVKGPYGRMTLHDDASRAAAFLTGGIGVTPFRSIALDAAHKRLPHSIHFFYSNRRPEDAPFLAELENLQRDNPHYHFVATMTNAAESRQRWTGQTGFIDAALLKRFIADLRSPVYYVAGPPGLVTAMQKMLGEAGVAPADVRAEEFAGY